MKALKPLKPQAPPRILFIGQAPPETMEGTPFKTTGLFRWLAQVGITYEPRKNFKIFHNQEGVFFLDGKRRAGNEAGKEAATVKFCALIDFFPGHAKAGGHLAPTPAQIAAARPALLRLVSKFKPNLIVTVGKLSAQEALGHPVKLDEIVGKQFILDAHGLKAIPVIPIPHPSGVSTWPFQPANKKLLATALALIRDFVQ